VLWKLVGKPLKASHDVIYLDYTAAETVVRGDGTFVEKAIGSIKMVNIATLVFSPSSR